MAQVVTIVKYFSLCDCTVVEWEHSPQFTEWVVARGIHITERPMFDSGRLISGETVKCFWDSGTYCTTKEGAMRIALEREEEEIEYLKERYKKPKAIKQ